MYNNIYLVYYLNKAVIGKEYFMKIELTKDEIKTLWVMLMSELSDGNKELAMKFTKALKEAK